MGRKKIDIDLEEVETLAGLGFSEEEIAISLGVSQDTIDRRKKDTADFADAIKRGKAKAKRKVTSKLMEKIEAGDLGAIIWYEKTRLGFSDKQTVEHTGKDGGAIKHEDVGQPRNDEDTARRVLALFDRARARTAEPPAVA